MITAIDTSVLLDVFGADPTFGQRSKEAIRGAIHGGRLVACDVVWAELGAAFPSRESLCDAMDRLGVALDALTVDAALAAGDAWKSYRRRGGRRTRVVADFLIGAHALVAADRLLTRDRGFYRSYFDGLDILQPATRTGR